jgi:hypothetical protein
MRLLTTAFFIPIFAAVMPAQSSKPNPCALLTRAEVQEAVGSDVSEGEIEPVNKSVCHFKLATGSLVDILLTGKGPGDNAARTVAELNKRKISAAVTPGFGDSAYSANAGYGMQQLGVYKGSSHVIVTVLLLGAPEAKSKAVAQTVMRKALARVP